MGDGIRDCCMNFDGLLARLGNEGGRRLIRISAELTHRCNFSCRHCYCRLPAGSSQAGDELAGAEWTRIINEAAAEGTFFITFTGGEPLLHPEFQKIWVAAKRAGLIPELFSNGSLIIPEVADFLAEWPPSQVSVTLYGSCEETYAAVTGRQGMLRRVLDGLDLLLERQVAVEVKGLFSRINQHDFDRLRELCYRYNRIFRWGAELTGKSMDGEGRPQEVGLDPEEVIALERRDGIRWDEWRSQLADWKPAPERCDTLFRCRVGQKECHVNPYGRLQPCLLLERVGYDLRRGSFADGWRRIPELLAGIPWKPGPCQRCQLSEVCRLCPAHALRLGEHPEGPTAFHCGLGRTRAEHFGLPAHTATHINGMEESR
jgi:radical SAM protein with 4Fe4S-binding SPASM domain